jgi:allantoinase
MPGYDLVVRGDLVLEDRVVRNGALGITDGRIAAVLEPGERPDGAVVRDHSGRYVMPGLVDTHVHAGSFTTESITSTTAAAAAGGVTTIVDMPYDLTAPVMGAERLVAKIAELESDAIVDVALYGTITKTDGVGAIDEHVQGGVCAFKFSTYEYDARRFPRIADGDLLAAFERLAGTGIPIVLHSELQEIVERAIALAVDDDARTHARTRPPVSETAAVAKALELAKWSGARLHVAHCTHPHTFRLIALYREMGAAVSGETCIHYLVLDEDDVARLGTVAKVNPPIRDRAARSGLWEHLQDGNIASISTDHAAWPIETKQRSMLQASAGTPGLETLLPLLVTAGADHEIALPDLLGYVTWRPAEIFGIGARKGRLATGFDADLAVFDARRTVVFDASSSATNARWSPFDGFELAGRVEATYVRGREVYRDGAVVAAPGSGSWLRRGETPDR